MNQANKDDNVSKYTHIHTRGAYVQKLRKGRGTGRGGWWEKGG